MSISIKNHSAGPFISGKLTCIQRYFIAATLGRMATGGSAVSIVLLATQNDNNGSLTGTLAACLTAPHILGPIYGRWLDSARDPRRILVSTALLFTGFFQVAILSFEWQYTWLTVIALLLSGTCSSFMMGGLSSQLMKWVEKDNSLEGMSKHNALIKRRAQSHDALTYSLGLTFGPLMIALLTNTLSASTAVALLMALPVLSALMVLSLPPLGNHKTRELASAMTLKQVFIAIRTSLPLTKTLGITAGAAFAVAALPVLAVYLCEEWQASADTGALLVTFYGIGCICGALFLSVKPLNGDALASLKTISLGLGASIILVALSQHFYMGLFAYWLCGVVNAIFFTATMAARTEYAPHEGASQIYMWVAAAKISAASAGALLTGVLVDFSLVLPLIMSVGVLGLLWITCFDKR